MFKKRRIEDAERYKGEVLPEDARVFEGPNGLDVEFKMKILSDIITCSLCDGFFSEAHTIKECLHTFCRSCIVGYMFDGGKQCPKCGDRFQGPVLEELAFDRTIQNFVDKMFPNFKKEEASRRAELYAFAGYRLDEGRPTNASDLFEYNSHGPGALNFYHLMNASAKKGLSASLILGSQGQGEFSSTAAVAAQVTEEEEEEEDVKKVENLDSVAAVATKEFLQGAKTLFDKKEALDCNNITIHLTPKDGSVDPSLEKPYIRVPVSMTVQYLMQYVLFRLNRPVEDWSEVLLTSMNGPLARTHSLEFVCRLRRVQFQAKDAILPVSYVLPAVGAAAAAAASNGGGD